MSKKNSLEAKRQRREARTARKLNFTQPQFYLVPIPGKDSYQKISGQCRVCLLYQTLMSQYNILAAFNRHDCKQEFLSEEDISDIDDAAYQIAKQYEVEEKEEAV